MKILVIESSPHKKGSSNLLAEHFIRGAEDAGHKITVFDSGHAKLHPCIGCEACGMAGPCCQKDDMAELKGRCGISRRIMKHCVNICIFRIRDRLWERAAVMFR